MDDVTYVRFLAILDFRLALEPVPKIDGTNPLPVNPDSSVGRDALSMINVGRGADVADSILQVKEGLGLLDVLFFSSH